MIDLRFLCSLLLPLRLPLHPRLPRRTGRRFIPLDQDLAGLRVGPADLDRLIASDLEGADDLVTHLPPCGWCSSGPNGSFITSTNSGGGRWFAQLIAPLWPQCRQLNRNSHWFAPRWTLTFCPQSSQRTVASCRPGCPGRAVRISGKRHLPLPFMLLDEPQRLLQPRGEGRRPLGRRPAAGLAHDPRGEPRQRRQPLFVGQLMLGEDAEDLTLRHAV